MTEKNPVTISPYTNPIMPLATSNPGIRYNELQRLSNLANGVLSYHIAFLERSKAIIVERHNSRTTRFYPINIAQSDSAILKHLHNRPQREIIIILLREGMMTHNELTDATGKAASTISLHLKRLREARIITVRRSVSYNIYTLANRDGCRCTLKVQDQPDRQDC
jgi:predicted transcriptional regulator